MMRLPAAAAFVMAAVTAFSALAHKGATGVVMERMQAMEAMSKVMRPLAQIMNGAAPYDAAAVRGAASVIAAHSGSAMTELFPAGSGGGASKALDGVWTDREEFSRLAARLRTAAAVLDMAAANAPGESQADGAALQRILDGDTALLSDVAGSLPADAVFVEISRICKQCHSRFRM